MGMILRLIVACFFVGSAIFFAEVARANKWVSGERARKLIHIMVGVWGAWLPLWLGFRSIIILAVMLLAGVVVSNKLKLFKAIHSVSRSTIGEYLFPVSMILLALFFKRPVLFAAGMLEMGLADGLAAVIGTHYGKKTSFKLFGNKKSIHGTVTFFFVSLGILVFCIDHIHPGLVFGSILSFATTIVVTSMFSAILTVAELTGQRGFDNISVPILTAIGLKLLS
jgi:phytol kinase